MRKGLGNVYASRLRKSQKLLDLSRRWKRLQRTGKKYRRRQRDTVIHYELSSVNGKPRKSVAAQAERNYFADVLSIMNIAMKRLRAFLGDLRRRLPKVKTGNHVSSFLLAALVGMVTAQETVADAEMASFAFVQEDGSLRIAGNLIRLYGIYIPPTDRTCYTFIRPVPCGPRAALALDFRISGDFVHCLPRATNQDGSITASCRSGNEDLSAWMLQHGWAVSLPDAPFEYLTMERLSQAKGIGIWGIPIDNIPRR